MATRVLRTIFHASSLAYMAYGFKSLDRLTVNVIIGSQFGGHFQFLTINALVAAWFTVAFSLLADLLPNVTILRAAKRSLMIVALPVSVVVSTIYWGLILLIPHLILPQVAPKQPGEPSSSSALPEFYRIPLDIDLALHATPMVVLILDFFLFETKYSRKVVKQVAPVASVVVATAYSAWAEYCAVRNNGIFPYPFLTGAPPAVRAAIYTGATFIAFLSFRLLNKLHS